MLLRVLQNIIQNLLRYADGQAKVTFSKEDSFIRLTVANPIKPGAQTSVEKVFQRFIPKIPAAQIRNLAESGFTCQKIGGRNGRRDDR